MQKRLKPPYTCKDGKRHDFRKSYVCRRCGAKPYLHLSYQERFWLWVRKTDTCWLWMGHQTPSHYGQYCYYDETGKRTGMVSHKYAWELLRGKVPEGKELDHRCFVLHCCNPDHLRIVTHQENMSSRLKAGFCGKGHDLKKTRIQKDQPNEGRCGTCVEIVKEVRRKRGLSRGRKKVIWCGCGHQHHHHDSDGCRGEPIKEGKRTIGWTDRCDCRATNVSLIYAGSP